MTYYIVLEKDWVYNDECFKQSGFGGFPRHIYIDKLEAETQCFQLNKQKLEGLDIYEYNISEFLILFHELPELVTGYNEYDLSIIKPLSDTDAARILQFIGKYPFYFVYTLEG